MKTFKDFREGVEEDEEEAYREDACRECGCDPKKPKEGCDCDHKNMKEEVEEVSKKNLGSYTEKSTDKLVNTKN